MDQVPIIILIFHPQNQFQMSKQKKQSAQNKKRHYSNISRSVKEKLIKKVIEEGYSISSASKQYKIKLSTVKAIVTKYKATNEISETLKQRKKRMEKENTSEKHTQSIQQSEPKVEPTMERFMYFWNPFLCVWMIAPLNN